MKKTKFALLQSVIALLLCCSMLIGTTFAWFTDSVTSGNNIIAAGNLDIELEYLDNGTWKKVTESTNVFKNDTLWEPGHTEVVYLKVSNAGSLALKYQLGVNIAKEVGSVNQAGDDFLLSDYIYFGAVEGVSQAYADRAAARAAVTAAEKISTGYGKTGTMEKGAEPQYVALVVYMPEETGNAANYATGENPPSITLGIELLATQMTSESDSYDKTYDENAAADFFPGFQGGTAGAAVTTDAQGATTAEVTVEGGDVSAVIPANVLVTDGVSTLTLTVKQKDTSDANVQLNADEEMRPLDVHIEGVAAGNTVPMLITLEHYLTTGINTGALRLYHVENGVSVPMTQVANPVNHNEFSYDPATGNVTLALASFSEVAVIADTNNPWNGETRNYLWYDASATELTIYNADQLAGFAAIVDGKAEGIAQDSFAGKTVKLNNNIYLSNQLFDPIGWGYEYSSWNRDGVAGKPFKGTFDGNGKVILDLYQNGWDLEEKTGTDYTYTNCGFGLFAAASGATFKNLTISGASVTVECVEAGVLVGLSQNSCTYENITIANAKIANYQRPAGGLIGEVSGDGTTTIKNVIIGSDVVVGSLWGDFDAPVGGVIGARWDDVSANPQIVMENVEVGARLDVYSDVTSAYQWYAYRRAGMLIGNTDTPAANGKTAQVATADFLTCKLDADGNKTVKVYYGDWAKYHYCQFTNNNNPGKNYPWVRVEVGENNSAYSNPRYGHPVGDDGNPVTDEKHTHKIGDQCSMEIPFYQLYGGGQGVYGQPVHDLNGDGENDVEVINYKYSITYVNDYQVLAISYISEEDAKKGVDTAHKLAQSLVVEWANVNIGEGKFAFGGWMNAGSTKLPEIAAGNEKDIVLYPYFNNPYTARFVDQQGNVISYCFFHEEDTKKLDTAKAAAEAALPDPGTDFALDYWEVHANGTKVQYNKNNFGSYKYDVTIYPVYRYTGNLKLTPVDEDNDGTIEYYKVEAVDALDQTTTIPGHVNGIPVKVVEKLYKNDNNWDFGSAVKTIIIKEGVESLERNSLGYTENLETVELPSTLNKLGKNVFSRNTNGDEKSITIKYNGTMADWKKVTKDEDWHNGLETGTRVICTDGYFELKAEEYLWGAYETYEWTEHPSN